MSDITLPYIEIKQPIGTFYLSKMLAKDIAQYTNVNSRKSPDSQFVQREEAKQRIKEIKEYCSDPDATFPTPIIISVYNKILVEFNNGKMTLNCDDNEPFGEVLDGQHRIKGLAESIYIDDFELPIILMFNLTVEESAYIFSIINSKQTQVSMSLIYDLFALSRARSPQKTVHEFARAFNNDENSPYYKRLKMLGKAEADQELPTLSQGTFVKSILKLITKDADADARDIKNEKELQKYNNGVLPLREFFIQEKDSMIYKVLLNCFNAVSKVFNEEWKNPNEYILSKTTGFEAIIKALGKIIDLGLFQQDLSEDFFRKGFESLKQDLDSQNKKLNSSCYPSNAQTQGKLAQEIMNAFMKSI